ncbi:MAG: hypothetical protein ACRYFY_21145 [Janthinobacterium lividum]
MELIQPGTLQRRIIIAVEVVEPEYSLASRQEGFRHMVPDKAGTARHQNRHGGHFIPSCINGL